MQRRYKGVFPVVPTTFHDDGSLDLESQKRCLDSVRSDPFTQFLQERVLQGCLKDWRCWRYAFVCWRPFFPLNHCDQFLLEFMPLFWNFWRVKDAARQCFNSGFPDQWQL